MYLIMDGRGRYNCVKTLCIDTQVSESFVMCAKTYACYFMNNLVSF